MWGCLKSVYCFDRYVDYRTSGREDGMFYVGALGGLFGNGDLWGHLPYTF